MKQWRLFEKNNTAISAGGYDFAKMLLKDKSILIVDDNEGILKWLKFSLEDYGAKIKTFGRGQDAIDHIAAQAQIGEKIDVVLLDIVMDEIGGLEIARFCKETQPQSLFVFITGCDQNGQEWTEASKHGLVIQKPVGIEEILRAIIAYFGKAKSEETS